MASHYSERCVVGFPPYSLPIVIHKTEMMLVCMSKMSGLVVDAFVGWIVKRHIESHIYPALHDPTLSEFIIYRVGE